MTCLGAVACDAISLMQAAGALIRSRRGAPPAALIAFMSDATIVEAKDADHGGDHPSFFYHQRTGGVFSAWGVLWPR